MTRLLCLPLLLTLACATMHPRPVPDQGSGGSVPHANYLLQSIEGQAMQTTPLKPTSGGYTLPGNLTVAGVIKSNTEDTLITAYPNGVMPAGVATYGGTVLPTQAFTVNAINIFVQSVSSGAGTTTIRISDGTSNCDATFDCAAVTAASGPKRAIPTGTCAFAASASLTVSNQSSTCATTQPNIRSINIVGKWQ